MTLMRGKMGPFVGFLGIAALVLGGLGFVTREALRIEDERRQAHAARESDRLRTEKDREFDRYRKEQEERYQDELRRYDMQRASQIRLATKKAALEVLAQAKAARDDMKTFRELAQQHDADPETRARLGDLGFFSKEGGPDEPTIPKAVREAAFALEKIGDVHLAWENEARLEVDEANGGVEIVYPPISFLAEPHVAIVTKNAERKGTLDVAKAYLEFLYTPEGQAIIAKNHYRPTDPQVLAKYRSRFPDLKLFKIDAVARSWDDASAKYFGDGGVFDSFYKPRK